MLDDYRIVILHNIISPYKTLLFNELFKIYDNLKVLYMAEKESNRDWVIRKDEIRFPYEIMVKGQLCGQNQLGIAIITWKQLNLLKPDVLILGGYSYVACWAGFFWARKNKKKIILWSASNEDDRKRIFFKEKLKGFFVKRCDAANVYGQKSRDYLVKLGMRKHKIFIKGNTADNTFYYSETMKLKAKRVSLCEQFSMPFHNFLYVGRFSQEKNILCLLKAYKRLGSECSWGLILVGDGPQRKEIEYYIKRSAINNVLTPGFQQKEEITKFFAMSDVFILPSLSEPWGLVVNEAMAAGFPVLVSNRCGCCPDIVREAINGFTFDPNDTNQLYTLMKNMAQGEYDLKKMGQAAVAIINNYTPERAARVIKKTIANVLQK